MAMVNENQTTTWLDATTMEIFEAFILYMQQQQCTQHKESTVTKCLQIIINKSIKFDGWVISKYIWFYMKKWKSIKP